MNPLFTPIRFGDITLKNRIVMSPLTRCRASDGRIPNALMTAYYQQRADFGMILTEAVSVTPMGVGYPDTPGIWNDEQQAAWKSIVDAVHAKGSRIVMQLWHVGRISDPAFLNGETPVSASAVTPAGPVRQLYPHRPHTQPRPLSLEEMPQVVAAYRQAAERAKAAGFDGVEVHGANGYLPDQFLQSSTNQRQDQYGGSIENRARFLLEITDACIEVWGAGRVGVHLSPAGKDNDMHDDNPAETWGYVAEALGRRQVAFLFLRQPRGAAWLLPLIRRRAQVPCIVNQDLTPAEAEQLVQSGQVDAVSFGRLAIANPDLPTRIAQQAPLNEPNPKTFYGHGAHGYTDYSFWHGA